jgi:Lon protease-like protein
MLPPRIPIFPLPNVTLFPGVCLPLHIFEPRYRRLVADVLTGERIIGITLLRPGWEGDYQGRPPVYETGCAGLLTHAEQLADGCYDIVLRGLARFRVRDEDRSRPYRLASVEALTEDLDQREREVLHAGRQQLEAALALLLDPANRRWPASLADDELVNGLSQYLDLQPVERQALLECANAASRCRLLLELLEMKSMTRGRRSERPVVH